MLVVSGMSYEDAATLCGCAEGTMKSRVNRARARLTELLDSRRIGKGSEATNYPASRELQNAAAP